MNDINKKIVDAIIEKADRNCPDALALIGIYGSAATGDTYAKSDLDLLILIKNDEGWQLGKGFLLDDSKIGYDIYCTTWDGLRWEAECHHAHLAKLMDADIVYVKDPEAYEELQKLRDQTRKFLASEDRFQRVRESLDKAKLAYADAYLYDDLGKVRENAFAVICNLLDAIMLYHGSYFKRGTKRHFEELKACNVDEAFLENMTLIVQAKDARAIRLKAKEMILYVEEHTKQKKNKTEVTKETGGNIAGTYEEMFSNWRNKVEEAAENNNAFTSFMNMNSFSVMYHEIAEEIDIEVPDIMGEYDPEDLGNNVTLYDHCLKQYEKVYEKAGLKAVHYENADAFVKAYLNLASDDVN